MNLHLLLSYFLFFLIFGHIVHSLEDGYILFCPCMGRFGNQMEQFLGVLAFAKHLNRTLVLPPLVEYPPGAREATLRDFDSLFKVENLLQYHRVVLMGDFMQNIAPKVWPKEKRKVLCWSARPGLANPSAMGCHATEGNPFGPFWRGTGVQFVGEDYFGERTHGFNTEDGLVRHKWLSAFPVQRHPVLAFTSPPASFPALPIHRPLQRFLQWSDQISNVASRFIQREFGDQPFVGVHLRNNADWDNVCRLVDGHSSLFASAQCTGPANEFGAITREACASSLHTVLTEIQNQVLRVNAAGVFVASDRHHHLEQMRAHLAANVGWPVRVQRWNGAAENVHAELAVLALSHHFVANCVSTFSAFVVRQRHFADRQPHRSTSFFAFPNAAMEVSESEKRNENDRRTEEL